jgi:hypothetical protein
VEKKPGTSIGLRSVILPFRQSARPTRDALSSLRACRRLPSLGCLLLSPLLLYRLLPSPPPRRHTHSLWITAAAPPPAPTACPSIDLSPPRPDAALLPRGGVARCKPLLARLPPQPQRAPSAIPSGPPPYLRSRTYRPSVRRLRDPIVADSPQPSPPSSLRQRPATPQSSPRSYRGQLAVAIPSPRRRRHPYLSDPRRRHRLHDPNLRANVSAFKSPRCRRHPRGADAIPVSPQGRIVPASTTTALHSRVHPLPYILANEITAATHQCRSFPVTPDVRTVRAARRWISRVVCTLPQLIVAAADLLVPELLTSVMGATTMFLSTMALQWSLQKV